MKLDIILSGVGGQGILTIATVIGHAAQSKGLNIKQAEVHGMSQRGGDVQSNLRISSSPIASDLIARGTADVIISLEPMEALRYIPFLKEGGWIITSSVPFINIPNYPDVESVYAELKKQPQVVMLDVEQMAKDAGAARAANIVLLGAAASSLGFEFEELEKGIREAFSRKGEEIVESNIKALRAGRDGANEINK